MAKQRILICGDRGMVGSALVRRLRGPALEELIFDWRPGVIIVAAAKVGGINAKCHRPVPFLYDNLAIEPVSFTRLPGRCRPPAVSWLVLHVSARRPSRSPKATC